MKAGASVDAPALFLCAAASALSENRVDEWGERGSFGESEQASYQQEDCHKGNQPKSLPRSHEPEQLRRRANDAHAQQTIQGRLWPSGRRSVRLDLPMVSPGKSFVLLAFA
jgi:hypothetical protein